MNYYFLGGIGIVGLLLVAIPNQAFVGTVSESVEYRLAQCGRGRTVRARSPQDALVPYVVSPRDTAILHDRAELRWNPVPGGNRYTVSLLNGETVIWTKEATTNQMPYPTDVAALQPGIDYTLVINASNGHSSTEDEAEQAFRLLSATEAKVVQQANALLVPSNTDETALLQANLYAGSGLYSDAIATLEERVRQGSQSATVHRQLGDLYAQTGLTLLAESIYLPALSLAANDLEEQAKIQSGLGNLYEAIGEQREAVRWLTEAKQSYEKLDNQYQVRQLEQRLQSVNQPTA